MGRTAYSERVKEVLKECRSPSVAGPLTADLARFTSGQMHDELRWKDVAIHACRVLQTSEKVLFVTVTETGLASVRYAREDGYRIIIVPDDIARALGGLTDLNGQPMFDLGRFHDHWNDSFSYRFIGPKELDHLERAIYDLTIPAAALAGVDLDKQRITVAISETTRLSERGAEVVAIWEPAERRIVIRRDQLADAAVYCGTLLHELTHALFGFTDLTFEFEAFFSRKRSTPAVSPIILAAVNAPQPAAATSEGAWRRTSTSISRARSLISRFKRSHLASSWRRVSTPVRPILRDLLCRNALLVGFVDPRHGRQRRWFRWRMHESLQVQLVGGVERDRTLVTHRFGAPVVDVGRRVVPDAGMAVVVVVPPEETSTEGVGVLVAAEAIGELRRYFRVRNWLSL